MALEIGLVGREGMLGIPLALGTGDSSVRALVQGSGAALRMDSAHFLRNYRRSTSLQKEIHRYIHERMVQITQTAACNRFHLVEARLARWLLMTRDRVQSDQFRLTQELLGCMLGVLRVAVTKAAGALQPFDHPLRRFPQGMVPVPRDRSAVIDLQETIEVDEEIPRGEPGPVLLEGRHPAIVDLLTRNHIQLTDALVIRDAAERTMREDDQQWGQHRAGPV